MLCTAQKSKEQNTPAKETRGDKKDSAHGKKDKQHLDNEKQNVENKRPKQSVDKKGESSGPRTFTEDPYRSRKMRTEVPKSDQPETKNKKKDATQEESAKQTPANKDKK
jgi:hypothetical protein